MSTSPPQHSDPLSARRDGRADTSTVRWQRAVPGAIRALGALADADYADTVTATDGEQMSLASFIRYDRWPAAFVWPPVSLIHRQVALALVRSAISAQ